MLFVSAKFPYVNTRYDDEYDEARMWFDSTHIFGTRGFLLVVTFMHKTLKIMQSHTPVKYLKVLCKKNSLYSL